MISPLILHKLADEYKQQILSMEDAGIPKKDIRIFSNKYARLSVKEKLLVMSASDALNPQAAVDVLDQL